MKKLLVLSIALLLALTGCGSKGSTEPKRSTTDYNYIYQTDITTMDYLMSDKQTNSMHTSNFIDGLMENDPYGNLVPALAESVTSNADKSVFTFKLKEGVKWVDSNGEEVDVVKAQDFVAGLRHALEFKSPLSFLVAGVVVNAEEYMEGKITDFAQVGVKALDDLTVEYTLTGPKPYFDTMTVYSIFYPVNEEFLNSKGTGCVLGAPSQEDCTFGVPQPDSILYNGPYILTNNTAKSVVEYKANEAYWDSENVHMKNIKLVYFDGKDPDSLFRAFDEGKYSVAPVYSDNEATVKLAEEKYGDKLYTTDLEGVSFYASFNYDRNIYTSPADPSAAVSPKTDKQKADTKLAILNQDFRKAVFGAFDRPALLAQRNGEKLKNIALRNTITKYDFVKLSDGTLYGELVEKALNAINPTAYPADIKLVDGQDPFYNAEQAKAYAAKAIETLTAQGVEFPVYLDMIQDANEEKTLNQTQAMITSIEAVIPELVKLNLVLTDSDNYNASSYLSTTGATSNWDLSITTGWAPDYGDPRSYLSIATPKQGEVLSSMGLDIEGSEVGDDVANKAAIGLTKYGELYEIADAEVADLDKRFQLFAEAEAYLINEAILYPYMSRGGSNRVTSVVPHTGPYADYGPARDRFKYMVLADHVLTKTEIDKANADWDAKRSGN